MKTTNTIFRIAASMFAIAAMLFISGCAKDEDTTGAVPEEQPSKIITDRELRSQIEEQVQQAPDLVWYNTTMEKFIVLTPHSEGKIGDFSDPGEINFIEPEDISRLYGGLNRSVLALFGQNIDITHYMSSSPINDPTASGVSQIGNSTMNLNNVVVNEPEESESGSGDSDGTDQLNELGGFGTPSSSGATTVVAIDGDLDALQTENFQSTAEVYQFLRAVVFLVVYTNILTPASYTLKHWFNYLNYNSYYLGGYAFAWAYVFSAVNWSIYFSQAGAIDVTTSAIFFQGLFFGAAIATQMQYGSSGSSKQIEYTENNNGFGYISRR